MASPSKDATAMWDIMSPEEDKAMMEKFSEESSTLIKKWSLGSASVVEKDAAVSFLVHLGAVQITIQSVSGQEASEKQVSIQFGDEQHMKIEQEDDKSKKVEVKDAIPSKGNLLTSVSQDQDTRERSQVQIDDDDDDEDDNNYYSAWMTGPDDGDDRDDSQVPCSPQMVEKTTVTRQPTEEHPCPDCQMVLHTTWDLDLHKLHDCAKSEESSQPVYYNCDQCRRSFLKIFPAVSHLRRAHKIPSSEVAEKLQEMKGTEMQKWREKGEKGKKKFSSKKSDEKPKRMARKTPGLKGTKRAARAKKGTVIDYQLRGQQKKSNRKRRVTKAGNLYSGKYVPLLPKRLCIRLQSLDNGWIKILEDESVDVIQFNSNSMHRSKHKGTEVDSNVDMAKSVKTSDKHQNIHSNRETDNPSPVSDNDPLEIDEGREASASMPFSMPLHADVEENERKLTELSSDLQGQVHAAEQVGEKHEDNSIPERKQENVVHIQREEESSTTMPMSQMSEDEEKESSSELAVLESDELQGQGCTTKQVGEENQGASTDHLMERESQSTDPETNKPHDEETHMTSELKNLHETADKRPQEVSSGDDNECKNKVATCGKSTVCPFCDLTFKTKYQRNQHMFKFHEEYPERFSCSTCQKTFTHKALFKAHVESHQDISERAKYQCKICRKVYVSKYNLKIHMNLHDEKKKLKCGSCDKAFESKRGLDRHVNNVHIKNVKYACEVCGKKFYSLTKVREHKESHIKERAFKCEECGKSFFRACRLKYHKKRVHSNDGRCLCDICGSSFKCPGNLTQHILTIHSNVYNFSCDVCGKKFKRTSHRNSHMKVHSDDPNRKPFKCEICSKGFRSKSQLKVHMNWHNNIRSFTCDVCGKSFLTNGNLTKHLYIHQSKKPHECQICSHGFLDLPGLRKHMDLIHKVTLKKVVDRGGNKGSAVDVVPANKTAVRPSSPSTSGSSDDSSDNSSEFGEAGHRESFSNGHVAQEYETSDGEVVRESLLAMMNA